MRGYWGAGAVTCLLFPFALLAGCQTVEHNTPSHRPEVVVQAKPAEAKAAIIGTLVNLGDSLVRDSDFQLVMEQQVDDAVANALLGSRYDPTVEYRMTFTFLPVGDGTRVIGEGALVTNGGTSFEKLTPVNNGRASVGMQNVLNDIAAGFAAKKPVETIVSEAVAGSLARKAAAGASSK